MKDRAPTVMSPEIHSEPTRTLLSRESLYRRLVAKKLVAFAVALSGLEPAEGASERERERELCIGCSPLTLTQVAWKLLENL